MDDAAVTHTGRMNTPIRPGTARRLGIRPPHPRGLIEIAVEMPDAELDAFAERFRGVATAGPMRTIVLTLDNRKRPPRRRWWQRRNR